MTTQVSKQIQLTSRPKGWPSEENFETVSVDLPDLSEGEVRVQNLYISVDPYMRGRMSAAKSYVAPFEVGETMTGGAVGKVVESRSDDLSEGALVLHQFGWRDVAQAPAEQFNEVPEIPGVAPSLYLGMLGLTGLTAYVGLTRVAKMQEDDVVFVSGAAGAVGSAVGQIAQLLGASKVIGSAGSKEKTDVLVQKYGYDVALNYKDAPIREQLPKAAPNGIDVYFDNVGGDHLEAALDVLNRYGRAALCGAISQYNNTEPDPGPDNMANFVKQSLGFKGFIVGDYMEYAGEFQERMSAWIREGKIRYDETVVDGLENATDAFISMMQGANTGKMVVRIQD